MKKIINLLILIFTLFVYVSLAQNSEKIIKNSTQPCVLAKSNLSSMGNLKLGSTLSEMKKEYPELTETNTSPILNSTAYITTSPFSEISHLLLIFSSESKLVSYTLVFSSQEWVSIEPPFKQALNLLKLNISRNSWTIWKENDRDTITVTCNDFAIVSTLSPIRNGQKNSTNSKRFLFTVADKSVEKAITGKSPTTNQSQKNSSLSTTQNKNPNLFPQTNSEFTVEFPQKPTIKTIQSEMGPVEQATFVSVDENIFRAEYGTATAEQLSSIHNATEEQLTQVGMTLGKISGYIGTIVTSGKTNLGTYIKLRGYKIIDGESFLIEHLMYYGKRSIMTIVTGAKSSQYPTTKIYNFINSLKRNFE